MKTILKILLVVVVMFSMMPMAVAQNIDYNDPKYHHLGKDVAEREQTLRKYSFMRDAYRMKSYDDYMRRYEELVKECPKCYQNMYLMGIKLNKRQLDATEDKAEKEKYINILISMFDLQHEHFGVKDGKIVSPRPLINKATFLLSLTEDYEKYKDMIKEAAHSVIEVVGVSNHAFTISYFGSLTSHFLNDRLTPDVILDEYDFISGVIEKSNHPSKIALQQHIDGLLLTSNAAACDNLIALFKPKYEKEPNNLALIKKIMRYLNNANCKGEFVVQLAEKYYKLEPSADAAYSLANTFSAEGDTEKALKYYKEAVSREPNRVRKSGYQRNIAILHLISKNHQAAANEAKNAIASDPRNGYAYFILAQAYSIALANNEVKPEDDFDKKAAFWLVADVLSKAKALTPPQANEMRDIIRAYNAARANAPNREDLFFRETLKVGDKYTVNCGWIKGQTTVKEPSKI